MFGAVNEEDSYLAPARVGINPITTRGPVLFYGKFRANGKLTASDSALAFFHAVASSPLWPIGCAVSIRRGLPWHWRLISFPGPVGRPDSNIAGPRLRTFCGDLSVLPRT